MHNNQLVQMYTQNNRKCHICVGMYAHIYVQRLPGKYIKSEQNKQNQVHKEFNLF